MLLIGMQQVSAVTYSRTFTEDTTWYYQQLTTRPTLIVEIEFSIVCLQGPRSLRFNLYTTEDNINLKKNCSLRNYGQLNNGQFWTRLWPLSYIKYVCLKDKNGLLHCTGKTVIQDFKPRTVSFSIGNGCDHPGEISLKGLSFNISVSGQRNKTDCVPLHPRNQLGCVKFYPFASFPNLFGDQQQEALNSAGTIINVVNQYSGGCYKFILELTCYMCIPKCDVTRNVTTPLCRETCWDFLHGCEAVFRKFYQDYTSDIKKLMNCDYLPRIGGDINCFYKAVTCASPPQIPNGKIEGGIINGTYPLHTQLNIMCVNETFVMKGNNTITCMYTGTWPHPPQCVLRVCPAPPLVEHAHLEGHHNVNEVYPWHTQVTYVCDNKTFHMEGNSTVTCLRNEHWSHVPECVEFVPNRNNQTKLKTLEIVLPTIFVVLLTVISSSLVILYKRKLKLKHNIWPDKFTQDNSSLTRMKRYDAFICYQFDADDDFVKNTIILELEQNHDPPFKLCIHENDFEPGYGILDNMQTAIQNSNSAILVMSQGFVDSMWCQQEFQFCYIEHMKDPAFKLFVIMMQPMDSLNNLTECMKQYFVQETYLKKGDEKLFTKIGSYLTLVKQPKDAGDATGGIDINTSEEQEGQSAQINEGRITTDELDVPSDITQDHTSINHNTHTRYNRNDNLVVQEHEQISNDPKKYIVVNDVDDISDNDENVPLLIE